MYGFFTYFEKEKIMKTVLRLLALILAVLMVSATFLACGEETPSGEVGTSGNNSTPSGENDPEVYKDLPQINWEGEEYRILGRQYDENNFKNFEVDYDEMPEDVVGLAVWNRNAKIKDK